MKTNELKDKPLDWAVAKCETIRGHIKGFEIRNIYGDIVPMYLDGFWGDAHFSFDWWQGGPIIERERIVIDLTPDGWCCMMFEDENQTAEEHGPTLLIAAMRCYVASVLGDEVDIPEELLS